MIVENIDRIKWERRSKGAHPTRVNRRLPCVNRNIRFSRDPAFQRSVEKYCVSFDFKLTSAGCLKVSLISALISTKKQSDRGQADRRSINLRLRHGFQLDNNIGNSFKRCTRTKRAEYA